MSIFFFCYLVLIGSISKRLQTQFLVRGLDACSNCIGFRSLFIFVLLRYYCKIHFWVKVGNLRVQIKDFI